MCMSWNIKEISNVGAERKRVSSLMLCFRTSVCRTTGMYKGKDAPCCVLEGILGE